MKRFNLNIDDTDFKCYVAKSDEDRKKGFSGERVPDKNECMLFVFPSTGKNQMWMKNTRVPLDMVFLDKGLFVLEIHTAEPNSLDLIGTSKETSYVIEFPGGTCEQMDIQEGDVFEDIPEEHLKPEAQNYVMEVLDDEGNVQMRIRGGERIFSRKSTKKIVEQALNAEEDTQYKKLAKTVLNEILLQDGRGSEYVQGKTKESYQLED